MAGGGNECRMYIQDNTCCQDAGKQNCHYFNGQKINHDPPFVKEEPTDQYPTEPGETSDDSTEMTNGGQNSIYDNLFLTPTVDESQEGDKTVSGGILLNKMIERMWESVLSRDNCTNEHHLDYTSPEKGTINQSELACDNDYSYDTMELDKPEQTINKLVIKVPSPNKIYRKQNSQQRSQTGPDPKYEYFNKNIEIFKSNGPMKIKPRKPKLKNLPTGNELEKMLFVENDDYVKETEQQEKDEYTKKGYAKPYKCDICKKLFSQTGHLNRHMRIHTGEKPYKCDVCGKEFSQSGDKARHERTHSTYRPYQCFICDREFNQTGHLQRHLVIHTEHIVYRNDGEFDEGLSRQKYMEAKEAALDKTQTCPLCGKVFVKKYLFERHVRSHTGETPYRCEECGKAFTRKDRLYIHKRIHSGEKPYTCKECGKGFNQGSHLKSHLRTHTGDKPYACNHCGKRFAQSCDRKKHERIHTGERPYACPLCDKAFNESQQLWKHSRYHDEVKEKGQNFKCRTCDSQFEFCAQFIHHIREHEKERCSEVFQVGDPGKLHSDVVDHLTLEKRTDGESENFEVGAG